MIDLALNQKKGYVNLKDIAKRQGISAKYLWQIITHLKSAKLVISSRGAKGGYLLAKAPDKIKIKEIITVLGDSLSPVACLENPKSCRRSNCCAAKDLWQELADKMEDFLGSITLQELAIKQGKKQGQLSGSMYYI